MLRLERKVDLRLYRVWMMGIEDFGFILRAVGNLGEVFSSRGILSFLEGSLWLLQ